MKRLFCISLVTLAVATSAHAEMKESPGTTMRSFVTNCEGMGGTIDEGGNSNILKCKLPSGTVVTCDFATSPPYCGADRKIPRKNLRNLLGNGVQSIDPATGSKGPKSESGGSSVGGNNTPGTGKGDAAPGPDAGPNTIGDGGGPVVK